MMETFRSWRGLLGAGAECRASLRWAFAYSEYNKKVTGEATGLWYGAGMVRQLLVTVWWPHAG